MLFVSPQVIGSLMDLPETFADKFLTGRIHYDTEVLSVLRTKDNLEVDSDLAQHGKNWQIVVKDVLAGNVEELFFDIVVLSTGVSISILV